jgi:hypothetical protein
MDKMKLVELLDKHINQEAFLKDLAIEMVIPWLEEKAKQSSTPIDDMVVSYLKDLATK